jgi:hypothetical protein
MEYTVQNVTMKIDVTNHNEFIGSCYFTVPFKHTQFMKQHCGMKFNIEFLEFRHDYGILCMNKSLRIYESYSPDLLISYLAWLLEQDGEQSIEVQYENPFWAIHDFEHALNDEAGCSIYVDKDIEKIRLEDAFVKMKEWGYQPTYEMIEEVQNAYKDRFGEFVSFEDYLEYEYEEE